MLNAAATLVVAKVRRDIRQFMGELLSWLLVIRVCYDTPAAVCKPAGMTQQKWSDWGGDLDTRRGVG